MLRRNLVSILVGFVVVALFVGASGCKSSSGSGSSVDNDVETPGGDGDNVPDPEPDPAPEPLAVTLGWQEPTQNSDGSTLDDLDGYNLYYGTSSRNYTHVLDVGTAREVEVTDLDAERYFFAVTAYDDSGNESGFSNEVSEDLR